MIKKEPVIKKFDYKIIKLSPRIRPDKENIIILPMFSEFGCETLGVLYCIPELLKKRFFGKYIIILAWQGREFLYRGLADEVWELGESYQWLKEYCKAFHHESKNLKRFEEESAKVGTLIQSGTISNVCVFPKLERCPVKAKNKPACNGSMSYSEDYQMCNNCGCKFDAVGQFSDLYKAKEKARWLNEPSPESFEKIKDFLPKNAIGVCARNRVTYGRNLSVEFYKRLIYLLEDMNYSPVWIGSSNDIYPCLFDRIPDFSQSPLSKDLENTFALISKMKFTVQMYTASSRLASLVGTPFLLVESIEQIYGSGQEGQRLNLLSKTNKKKLIIRQFLDSKNDSDALLKLVIQGIEELESDNFEDILTGSNMKLLKEMKEKNNERIGNNLFMN